MSACASPGRSIVELGPEDTAFPDSSSAAFSLPCVRLTCPRGDFLDQWDSKSPWHDRRVRLAASHAIDRQALSDAETLGASRVTGSLVPAKFDPYAWSAPLEDVRLKK